MKIYKGIPLFCKKCGKRIPNRKDRKNNMCLECSYKNRCKICGKFLKVDGIHLCNGINLRGPRFFQDCGRLLNNDNYERWKSRCGSCDKKIQRQKERELKDKLIQQLGGKCRICGYDKFKECLEFHHIDKDMKKSKHFLKDVLKYPEKFELLCNRCHREKEIIINMKGEKNTDGSLQNIQGKKVGA